jgi:DNA-binding MarR family transcriptional regulator
MRSKLNEGELRAWQALLHAHHQVTRTLDAELRERHGLSLNDYDILLRLVSAPERCLRMSDLAVRVMIPASTLTRRLDRLVADGLVERRRLETDSRVLLACLTKTGRRAIRRAAPTHLRGVREHYTGRLSKSQLGAVADGLEVITGSHAAH